MGSMAAWITNDPHDAEWAEKLIMLLKVVARVEAGDKLCTEGSLFHVEPAGGWLQSVRRALGGEGRHKNLQRVAFAVQHLSDFIASEFPTATQGSAKDQLMMRCLAALRGSIGGLRNLSVSYGHDACAMAQIDCLIERIEAFLEQYV